MRSPKVPWTLTILTENNHWAPVYSAPGFQMPLWQLRQLPESTHSQFQNISDVNLCETTENTCIQKYRKYYPTHPSQSSKMMHPNLELANKVLQNKNCSCTFAAAASMILRSSSRSSQTSNNAQTRRAVACRAKCLKILFFYRLLFSFSLPKWAQWIWIEAHEWIIMDQSQGLHPSQSFLAKLICTPASLGNQLDTSTTIVGVANLWKFHTEDATNIKHSEPEQIQNMPHVHLCGLGYLAWGKLIGTKWNKIKHDW